MLHLKSLPVLMLKADATHVLIIAEKQMPKAYKEIFHMFVFYVTFYSLCLGVTTMYNDTGDDILAPAPPETPNVGKTCR